jgi:Histidine kinase
MREETMNSTTLPASPQHDSSRAYWTCQLAGWGVYAAVQIYAAALVEIPLLRAAAEIALLHGAALVLTHLLRDFMRRRHWRELRITALAPRVLAASCTLGIPLGLLNSSLAISALREPDPLLGDIMFSPQTVLLLHLANWSLIVLCWCIVYFGILTARQRRWAELRQSELARALQLAELRVLKSQLNPHFLFNSLNTVRALIAEDPARAQRAVTHLARTLRYTLNSGQEELVSLAQELEIVGDYLALEQLRFGERLRVERDVADEALGVRIPVMLLQTIVENAIKHGIAELPQGGTLHIRARVGSDGLEVEVENPRPDPAATRANGEGVGLLNAAERLRLLFGSSARLELDLAQPGRAVMRVLIPHRG